MNHQTVSEAREGWKKTIAADGGSCPCCDRWGKIYGRAINKTMAKSLKWLYDACQDAPSLRDWIDVPNTAPKSVLRSNQLATLRWWGLVERRLPEPDENVKHTGMWRMTLRGMDFVEGKLLVPRKVFTYNGDVVSVSDDQVAFKECTGNFDIDATMTSTSPLFPKLLTPPVVQGDGFFNI